MGGEDEVARWNVPPSEVPDTIPLGVQLQAQTEALAELGFTAAVSIGGGGAGLFGVLCAREVASCVTCGALVLLHTRGDGFMPCAVHREWHLGGGGS